MADGIVKPVRADLPSKDEIGYGAVYNESDGNLKHLRGAAYVQTSEMKISADEIDFDSDTDWAKARGHVRMEHYATGDVINAERGEYNIRTEEGKFYSVNGTSPAKILTNPGVLSTSNPFYFQALWAERIKNRYIFHHGFITDCRMPKPWWIFQAPVFDVVPGNRAIARHTVFRLKRVPVFYLPFFYRPLGRNPRQSGFLTPNFGHSTLFGWMYGAGYYWAINRSYDMTGIVQNFSLRGPAITYDFRGKPNEDSDFNFRLYDVQDKGVPQPQGKPLKEGGLEFELTGTTQLLGFTGRLDYNYLSSFLFREVFSYSFSTAITNDVGSIGFLQRRFDHDTYTLNIAGQRDNVYEGITFPSLHQIPNEIVIQKLPSLEFSSRDQQVVNGRVPVWFSFNGSASLLDRQEPVEPNGVPTETFDTGALGRIDLEPHVNTAFNFKGFSLEPGVTLGTTDYTNSYSSDSALPHLRMLSAAPALSGESVFRQYADFTVSLGLPTVERIFAPPKWLHMGEKVKHTVEARADYEYVTGVNEFQRILHFDQTDILSNTNQLTLSLINRLYRKDKTGNVSEFLTWRLTQARYFDPTFGGVVLAGQRNVVLAAENITPYTFLDGPRNYSPIASNLTLSPYSFLAFDWRTDYDPARRRFVDQTVSVIVRHQNYFSSVSDSLIDTNPILLPKADQVVLSGGYGSSNRKGWNIAGTMDYDRVLNRRLFDFVQASYNSDCCGFSVELRRYNIGVRNESQYLFSFSLANLGTFGSLQRQGRIF